MIDKLDAGEFMTGYLAEVEEHLSASRASIVAIDAALRKNEAHPRAVRDLFRSLHTVKGLSGMVGADPIVDVAHELETLLRAADKAGGTLPARSIDGILQGVSFIEEAIATLSKGGVPGPAPVALLEALATLSVSPPRVAEPVALSLPHDMLIKLGNAEREELSMGIAQGRRGARVEFVPSAERAQQGMTITTVREKMATVAEIVKVIPRAAGGGVAFMLLLLTDATDDAIAAIAGAVADDVHPITVATPPAAADSDAALPEEAAPIASEQTSRNFVRVDVARLDDALECLAALVVTRSKLERAAANLADRTGTLRALDVTIAESGRQLRALRGAIMRARMVSVAELLDRAPLLVRGLSRSSHKRVALAMETGRSELDKAVADRLFPAIVHLLRNAVDHAIEPPEERKALGKSEEGQIRITCVQRSGSQVAVIIADDGRGIDAEKVARRAGVSAPSSAAELFTLIARPGLSTMDHATHTSGRGLGMDIVKKVVVDELGGEVHMTTTRNRGTTFTLLVPLSVTILDVFTFACGTRTFVVPVSAVDDLTEIEPGRVSAGPNPRTETATVRVFQHRGVALPLFALGPLLGCAVAGGARTKAIIVRQDSEAFAFEVDRMLGQKEVVIRPVNDPLVDVQCVSGTTDLGDGKPTLVLDLLALARHSSSSPSPSPSPSSSSTEACVA